MAEAEEEDLPFTAVPVEPLREAFGSIQSRLLQITVSSYVHPRYQVHHRFIAQGKSSPKALSGPKIQTKCASQVNALPAPRTPAPPEKGSKKSLRIRKPSKFVPFGWAVQRRGAAAANQAAELLLPPKVEPKKEKTEEKLEEKLEEVKEKEESEKEESEMEEKEEGEEEEEGEEGEEEEEGEDNDDDPTYSE